LVMASVAGISCCRPRVHRHELTFGPALTTRFTWLFLATRVRPWDCSRSLVLRVVELVRGEWNPRRGFHSGGSGWRPAPSGPRRSDRDVLGRRERTDQEEGDHREHDEKATRRATSRRTRRCRSRSARCHPPTAVPATTAANASACATRGRAWSARHHDRLGGTDRGMVVVWAGSPASTAARR